MLKNTFIHIPGIGNMTEQRLWESGIQHWDQFTSNHSIRLSPTKMNTITTYLEQSYHHLKTGNPNYFSERLPANLHWRFFPEFRNSIVYLDIETTGLESWSNKITTIALYDGNSICHYVNGQNLDDFVDDIKKYKVIVTYNGKSFDVLQVLSHTIPSWHLLTMKPLCLYGKGYRHWVSLWTLPRYLV